MINKIKKILERYSDNIEAKIESQTKKQKQFFKLISLSVAVVCLIIVVIAITKIEPITTDTDTNIATGLGRKTNSGYLASNYEILLDKAIEYKILGDSVALLSLINSRQVFILKGNIDVYVTDIKIFKGIVKIRPAGQLAEYWTSIEALKDDK